MGGRQRTSLFMEKSRKEEQQVQQTREKRMPKKKR